jgi:NifB/MoaA-like Fe-S oxidoreductase
LKAILWTRPAPAPTKCLFCFIDQLPPGLRESLYFKDDDARLSFLTGNYITLTTSRCAS